MRRHPTFSDRKLAPDDADTRFNLGVLHHERGELDDAVTQFKEALRLKPLLDQAKDKRW